MDLSGWVPPEFWIILGLGTLVVGWIVYQVMTIVAAHITISFQ